MSTQFEALRALVRELIKKELAEASVTGAIDGGEGPPQTPYAFKKKKKKDDDSVTEAAFHVKTEMGSIIIDAGGKGEAITKVAKALKSGRKE